MSNAAERAIAFIREQLSLPDGRKLGETLPADPWIERDVLRPILAANGDGPLHSLVYIELARGHFKTGAVAAVAIAEALREPGTDVYCVASDLDQARLLTEAIEGQRRRNKALARALHKSGDTLKASNGSKIKVMSSDAPSAYGIGVDCRRLRVICDELTQWPKPALYHAMITTLPKVADSQVIVISNAGVGPGQSWQWGVREAARAHGYLFTAEGTIASWIRPADLAQVEATVPPPIFARFYRNVWVEEQGQFVEMALWDSARAAISKLDAETRVVIGVDAAVSGDCFAVVAVSRDPERPKDSVVVRDVRIWRPEDAPDGRIDFSEPEKHLRRFAKEHNVAQICYDPYQLEDMAQRLRREFVAWVEPFSQQADRAQADSALFQLIRSGRIKHDGDPGLREHVANCGFKVAANEDTRARLVKRGKGKIDAAVALSMAASRCLYLVL